MQETRQYILEILKESGQATVDDIVSELRKRRGNITAVTVRHHLTRLQEADLVTAPRLRHRNAPGRPQHVYALSEKALNHFPNNYQQLAVNLLQQIRQQLPPEGVNVIIEGVADAMAAEIPEISGISFEQRLSEVIVFLNERGYKARLESHEDGYTLHTVNCPYHEVAQNSQELCDLDMRLISTLLGAVPRRIGRISDGDTTCSYFIPARGE